ncbi:MAG: ferredoxin [Proteobacteria bacterium]|nr:ferredoxin [Pseudomonadota bacterium]
MAPKKLVAIRVDPVLCVGSGMCISAHPDRFAFKPDGHADYVGRELDEATAAEAAELCPVSAISLVYEETEGR